MEFFTDYISFFAKTVTLMFAAIAVVGAVAAAAQRHKKSHDEKLQVKNINQRYRDMEAALNAGILGRKELKARGRQDKKDRKARDKKQKQGEGGRGRIYVLEFHGDMQASAVASLREEVSALLTVAGGKDEVVMKLESGGGMVHGYGLAASQLARLKERGIPLTVAVDKVAASGGYLMACVANTIIAAPFAVIGSIGVLAQIPNLHRLLKKHDIDFEQFTAGEFKRTVTFLGPTTDKARDKMQRDVEDMHRLFKDFVIRQRPGVDIEKVSTGEHWPALRALELGLVDKVQTSDDYLMSRRDHADIYAVKFTVRQTLAERLRLPFINSGSGRTANAAGPAPMV